MPTVTMVEAPLHAQGFSERERRGQRRGRTRRPWCSGSPVSLSQDESETAVRARIRTGLDQVTVDSGSAVNFSLAGSSSVTDPYRVPLRSDLDCRGVRLSRPAQADRVRWRW